MLDTYLEDGWIGGGAVWHLNIHERFIGIRILEFG